MIALAIETSCDDTCAAVFDSRKGLIADRVAGQDDLHAPYGGIVPELASRRHVEMIDLVVADTMKEADLKWNEIDLVAATVGPGLIGSLAVGLSYAKSVALALGVPFVGVDHLEGHLHSVQLGQSVEYPFLGLLVSGGHSNFYRVEKDEKPEMLGGTIDDAVGEVFDKIAKMLGWGYPGGARIEKAAVGGDRSAFDFPRPMSRSGDLRMSFSGLKTAVAQTYDRLTIQGQPSESTLKNLCASFQDAVADTLGGKLRLALEQTGLQRVVLVGGVAANQALRSRLIVEIAKCGLAEGDFYAPPLRFCRDNAAMIVSLAVRRMRHAEFKAQPLSAWEVYARH